ncbi:MAG: hypothetical protein LKH93_20440 [Clostridium beijerinckii]|nr:hypothetical protein [Clostridium beijerinckii]MCI1624546.1 hypothetical protein [Clostridium beijerinckii]
MIDSNKINSNNKWKGFKDFLVYKTVKEDEVVTSFYLGGALKPPIFICSIPKYSNL